MAILASLPGINLFSSFPSTPPPNNASSTASTSSHSPSPPIPVPKYPPPRKSRIPETASPKPSKPSSNPALKLPHRQTHYYKPVKDGVIASDGDRAVLAGESGVSYLLPGAPFEFQYSYTETPKAKPLAIREPAFLPFAPPTMPRPWTGKAPLKKSKKKNIPLFDSFNPPPPGKRGVKYVEKPGPFPFGKYPDEGKTREEILGEPLTKSEIKMLVKPHLHDNRQVNLGRDGLTHNMLELVHTHWKRRRVCKVRCKGVPTVDMDNVCRHLEEKTGGKIIHRVGGVVYIFRGRNYNYRTRPQYPLMIWKPAAPVYPKLIQKAPEGLTEAEADELREKGKSLLPICKLAKNGVYLSLVKDVRDAFEGSALVKIDCKGMEASDYKKLGAKLKELVPCVLLSFDDEQILMWRGRDWKSRYPEASSASRPANVDNANDLEGSGKPDTSTVISSPKMISLWKRAIESSKALLLNEINLGPEDLLKKVEEFEGVSLVPEHSYTALVLSSEDGPGSLTAELGDSENYSEDDIHRDSENYNEDDICRDSENYSEDNIHRDSQNYSEDDIYRDSQNCSEDEIYSDDEGYESDSFDVVSSSIPFGSLPVDQIAKKLGEERK